MENVKVDNLSLSATVRSMFGVHDLCEAAFDDFQLPSFNLPSPTSRFRWNPKLEFLEGELVACGRVDCTPTFESQIKCPLGGLLVNLAILGNFKGYLKGKLGHLSKNSSKKC